MTDCGRRFDEELISGYLDGLLTQGDRQRVGLHLETCAACRSLYEQMAAVRSLARGTVLRVPDEGWRETPRRPLTAGLRRLGWVMVLLIAVGAAGFLGWQLAISAGPLWEKVVVFGGLAGGSLLALSVLLDRLHDLPGDRYRGVQK